MTVAWNFACFFISASCSAIRAFISPLIWSLQAAQSQLAGGALVDVPGCAGALGCAGVVPFEFWLPGTDVFVAVPALAFAPLEFACVGPAGAFVFAARGEGVGVAVAS
jgi:hypothetical protein